MSEFKEFQPKSDLRLYIEASGRLSPEQVNFLWEQMGQYKDLYARVKEIYDISQKNPEGAEIMLEKLRSDLEFLKNK